ncbi:lipoate--protein ligase family protein [Martelella soudanensis]|uniref:lipoate--protein ligase family protein n=1 Tax=Martelella sp. NC20 TaxID=2740298 RepID=UPI003530031B
MGRTFPPSHFAADIRTFATARSGLEQQERLDADLTPDTAPLLMAWQAPRALIVGRSDARLPGFARAEEKLAAEGWPVLVRRSGGSACPVSPGTFQIALVRASAGKGDIEAGYRTLASLIDRLLSSVGVQCEVGERTGAFCPGRYDLGVGPRKFAGLSQHWRSRGLVTIVTTAASIIVEDNIEEFCRIVNLFYEKAGKERQCSSAFVTDVKKALSTGITPDVDLIVALQTRLAQEVDSWSHKPFDSVPLSGLPRHWV